MLYLPFNAIFIELNQTFIDLIRVQLSKIDSFFLVNYYIWNNLFRLIQNRLFHSVFVFFKILTWIVFQIIPIILLPCTSWIKTNIRPESRFFPFVRFVFWSRFITTYITWRVRKLWKETSNMRLSFFLRKYNSIIKIVPFLLYALDCFIMYCVRLSK